MNTTSIEMSAEQMRELYESGKSIYRIGEAAGCHPRTVHQRLTKLGVAMRATNVGPMSEEQKQLRRDWAKAHPEHRPMVGRRLSEETKALMSQAQKGPLGANWKGGRTAIARAFRRSKEYVAWRRAILARANGICQQCGQPAVLEGHHVASVSKAPSLALDTANGIALCHPCHQEADRSRQ